MRLDKLVYRHRRLDNNEVFYIGIGNKRRPYSKRGRNKYWKNIVSKTEYAVEILATNLSVNDACDLEMLLISEYGRNKLANMTDGGEGQFNPNKETRYKIGSAMRGKTHKKETIEKIIENGNKGKTISKEQSELRSINSHIAKMVVDLQTGIFYHSLKNACESVNMNYASEWQRIKKYNKNYRFQFI